MGFLIFLIVSSQTGYTAREYQPSPAEIRVTEFAYKTQNTDSLIAFIKDALVTDSLNVKLHRSYQDTRLGAEKDRSGLLREYEKLLSFHPQSPDFLYLLGRIKPDTTNEKNYYEQAYKADSNNYWTNYGLGAFMITKEKNYDGAKKYLDRAIAIDNSIFIPFYLYANYDPSGDLSNKERFLSLALICEPYNTELLQALGSTVTATKHYGLAVDAVHRFLTRKPELPPEQATSAYELLVEILIDQKDFDAAQAYLDTIKILTPKANLDAAYIEIYANKNEADSLLTFLKQWKEKFSASSAYNWKGELQEETPEIMKDKKLVQYFKDIRKELGLDFPAKPIAGTTADGKELSLKQFKGKIVLIDFWASWCGPCRGETPFLIGTYSKYHAQGLEIIGVNIDNNREAMDGYLKDNPGMVWPQVYSGKAWKDENAVRYGVKAIPQIVLVDKKGILREISLRGEGIEKAVSKYLE